MKPPCPAVGCTTTFAELPAALSWLCVQHTQPLSIQM